MFSGLMQYNGGDRVAVQRLRRPVRRHELAVRGGRSRRAGPVARARAQSGEQGAGRPGRAQHEPAAGQPRRTPPVPPYDALVRSLLQPPPQRDQTLQDPRCVFQIVKRHFAATRRRWSSGSTGCPKETFLKVAETIARQLGPDRTTSFCYAVGWTQHTNGVQIIGAARCCSSCSATSAGRAAGSWRCAATPRSRARPTSRRSTTRSTATCRHPSALQEARHADATTCAPRRCRPATGPTCRSSWSVYLKSMYGDAATKENDFGYDWHPKIIGDHSHMPMFVGDGRRQGARACSAIGQNPARRSTRGSSARRWRSSTGWS